MRCPRRGKSRRNRVWPEHTPLDQSAIPRPSTRLVPARTRPQGPWLLGGKKISPLSEHKRIYPNISEQRRRFFAGQAHTSVYFFHSMPVGAGGRDGMARFKPFHPAPAPSGPDRTSPVTRLPLRGYVKEQTANPQLAITNPNKDGPESKLCQQLNGPYKQNPNPALPRVFSFHLFNF
jgi:hypothetical protein